MTKLLITDVDGTLTDSSIYYSDKGIETKAFSTKDGAILKCFQRLGIPVIFLTGRESEAVKRRTQDLGAKPIQGTDDKCFVLDNLFIEYEVKAEEVAYIGDDLNDYKAMLLCGFKACPADAVDEIKSICDFVSKYNGGQGAVRECCEFILTRDGKFDDFLNLWME